MHLDLQGPNSLLRTVITYILCAQSAWPVAALHKEQLQFSQGTYN